MNILLSTIPTLLMSLVTFLLTRRKYMKEVEKAAAEVDSNEIDNVERAAKIWRELSEEIQNRLSFEIQALRNENKQIRDKVNVLNRENSALRHQMIALEKELRSTKVENEKLIDQLKQFNERLKDQ